MKVISTANAEMSKWSDLENPTREKKKIGPAVLLLTHNPPAPSYTSVDDVHVCERWRATLHLFSALKLGRASHSKLRLIFLLEVDLSSSASSIYLLPSFF